MGSSDIPTMAETRAFEVVSSVTGARVDHTDGRSAPPRSLDARLTYADGRTGWLEVSTLAAPAEMELLRFLPRYPLPSPGNWNWIVVVERRADLVRAQATARAVVTACEQLSVEHPGLLPQELLNADSDLAWAATQRAIFFGVVLPPGARADRPTIHFKADDWLATSRFGDISVTAALNDAFEGGVLQRRIEKLAASDADERHLYLRVTKRGIGEGNLFVLASHAFDLEEEGLDDIVLNAPDPELPKSVTHLWLDSLWGTRVTRWARGLGWDHPVVRKGTDHPGRPGRL